MKNLFFLLSVIIVFTYCAPTTKITGSWKNSKQPSGELKTVFIAALTGNVVAKSTLESNMARALTKQNIQTIKSVDEFSPGFLKDSIPKNVLMAKIKKQAHEGILTISLLKKTTESRYVRGGYAYSPMGRFGYYDNFYGYYSYWSPYVYNPGYYEKEDIYYLETNMYDSQTETLLWSAQSQTYSYDGLSSFSEKFSNVIVNKLKKDGVIK
ncbi:MAG: hypothetical protein ABIP51_20180 [Bacteroidia bacterium]